MLQGWLDAMTANMRVVKHDVDSLKFELNSLLKAKAELHITIRVKVQVDS